MGSAHALASTVIAFENRDVVLRGGEEEREGERERGRAAKENQTRLGTEGNYSLPLRTHRRQSYRVRADNERQVAWKREREGERTKQVVPSVR